MRVFIFGDSGTLFCAVCFLLGLRYHGNKCTVIIFSGIKKGREGVQWARNATGRRRRHGVRCIPPPPYITPLHLRSSVRKLLPWQQRRSPTAGVVLMLLFPSFLNNTFPSFVKGWTKRGKQSWLKHASCYCNVNYFSVMQTWGPFHNGQLMITLIQLDSKF